MATEIEKYLGISYINHESPKASQNNKIKITLKPHQLSLVKSCLNFEKKEYISVEDESSRFDVKIKPSFGVIADNVGSGKTYVALSLVANGKIKSKNEVETQYSKHGEIEIKKTPKSLEEYTFINTDVIAVPHNIIHQWVEALNNTDLTYLVYHKKKEIDSFKKNCVKDSVLEKEDFNLAELSFSYGDYFDVNKIKSELEKYNVILVSSTKFNNFAEFFYPSYGKKMKVNRLFFDEADTINIANCCSLKSNFCWFITSTYENLLYPRGRTLYKNLDGTISNTYSHYSNYDYGSDQSRVRVNGIAKTGFIRDTCYYLAHINIDQAKILILKNDPEYVKASFMLEEPARYYVVCDYDRNLFIVKDYVSAEVLNRLSAGDIKGAIEKIDCEKVNSNDNLVELVTKDISNNLHNAKLELQMKQSIVYSSKKSKEDSIARSQEKVFELESKINNIRHKIMNEDICPICYDKVVNTTVTPCCNTKYCLECITMCATTGNSSCPFCRAELKMNDLIILTDTENIGGGEKASILKDKIFALRNIIASGMKNPNFKLLIFADYDASFDNLLSLLSEFNLKYFMIKGSSSSISKNIDNYKSTDQHNINKIDVLLLNSNHCGSGINLENTSDLVIYHDMTDSKITQVIGRAQRPGRTSKLNIWRLLNDYEVPTGDIVSNKNNIGTLVEY